MHKHASLNRVFRLVWSCSRQAWVAVAENAPARGKSRSGRKRLAVLAAQAAVGLLPGFAWASPPPTELPTGGQVVGGSATIGATGAVMNVDQTSQRAVIDWQSFNVGSAAQVNFNQPSSTSATLNRVLDNNPSQIAGSITANGQVIISNPNGVVFAAGAQVDVGALTATTHSIGTADFMAGLTTYSRNGATGAVINQGQLTAALGGYIALLAPEVRNEGVVVARAGAVVMAAGEAIRLDFDANNTLVGITATPSEIEALIENRHAVYAPGGLIVLSARAADSLQGGVVRNSGVLSATSLTNQGGRIVLGGDDVQLAASSVVEARGATSGGQIDIIADRADLAGVIDAGGEQGGAIQIEVADTARIAATIAAQGASAAGGTVSIEQLALATAIDAPALEFMASANIDVSGATDGGRITVAAQGSIDSSATMAADGNQGVGGSVGLTSQSSIELADATLRADGETAGGRIEVTTPAQPVNDPFTPRDSRPNVALIGATALSANGRRGRGGRVALTGRDLLLDDSTSIITTGSSGGVILVGGEWQGSGDMAQATTVHLSEGVRLDASALEQGDGGTIVVWSDVGNEASHTSVHGTLRARGAGQGDGGRIETSGHRIDIDGVRVNAGAEAGVGGLWLIDPYNYTIGTAQAAAIVGNASSGLNSGTSVTVTTTANTAAYGSSGNSSDVGNITVSNGVSIAKTMGNDATLTLQAHRNISFGSGSSVTSSSGALNLVLWSRLNPGSDGTINLNNTTVTTNGGHVWMGGGAAATTRWQGLDVGSSVAATWSAGTAALMLSGGTVITTGGGHFHAGGLGNYTGGTTASWTAGVQVDNARINTGTGDLTLRGEIAGNHTTSGNTSSALQISNNSVLSSTSGVITLQGSAAATNTSAGTVFGTYLTNRSTVQSVSGAINIYGTTTVNSNNGAGIWLGSSSNASALGNGNLASGYNVSVLSDSGNILMDARAQNTIASGWSHAFILLAYESDRQRLQTNSGNITIKGDANVARDDSSAVQFQVNTGTGNLHVVSSSGDIYVQGFQHSGSTHLYNNALRISAGASVGSIRFGAINDAAVHTGRITFEADSIWSRAATAAVPANAIKAYGTGELVFQSTGASSVKDFLLAGTDNNGVVEQSNVWDFGSAHSGISIGKPTETRTVTLGSVITAAGPITVQGGNIVLNNHLTSTRAGAAIRLLARNSISSTASAGTNLQLDTNAGQVVLASDTDNLAGGNIDLSSQSLTIDTRSGQKGSKSTSATGGGSITLGGGNLLGTGYATGTAIGTAEGIRASDMTLLSGGGDIHLRGRSWSGSVTDTWGAWGVGIYRNDTAGELNINSGAGRVRIEGIGQSWGSNSYKQGIAVYGATTILSSFAGNDAIQLLGSVTATAATGNGNRSALDLRGAATIAATGAGGGLSLHGATTHSAVVLRGAARLLTNGGDLRLTGTRLAGSSSNELFLADSNNVWLGSAAGSQVTATSSNLLLEFDALSFTGRPNVATTGAVTLRSNAASFAQSIQTEWLNWNRNGQTITGLTIGRVSNTAADILVNGSAGGSTLLVNGPVTVYGRTIDVSVPLQVSGDGDIYLRSYADGNTSLRVASTISKTGGGDATLTLHGNGRVNVYNSITASGTGTGRLNVIVWADADGNHLGGASFSAHTMTTNGGHVWIGGGAGTAQWNGLTVGDGASPGAYGSNYNGLDLDGTFNTGGGDFQATGKTFVQLSTNWDINAMSAGVAINAAGGDVTFIGNRIDFGGIYVSNARTAVNTTGTLTLRPYDDSFTYSGGFNVVGALSGNDWVGTSTLNSTTYGTANLIIRNAATLGGLIIGKDTNTSAITVRNSLSIAGDISLHGGRIANANNALLGSTAGSILLDADRGRGLDFNGRGVLWSGGGLTASSSAPGAGNITVLGRGGSKVGDNQGVFLVGATFTAGGDIMVQGIAPAQRNTAVYLDTGTSLNAGRTLTVDGRNFAVVASPNNRGVLLSSNTSLSSVGALNIIGRNGPGASNAIELNNGASVTTSGSNGHIHITALNSGSIASVSGGNGTASIVTATGGGNITLTSDALAMDASKPLQLTTTGVLTIEPFSSSFPNTFLWDGALSGSNFVGGGSLANVTIANLANLGGLTLGKIGNASGIRIAAGAQARGPIRLYGHDLTLNGSLMAAGNAVLDSNRIELHASGNVTQAAALSAHGLALLGAGRFMLEHQDNDVSVLVAGSSGARVGRVSYSDANALTIGSVAGYSGLHVLGTVNVATVTGDLQVAQDISSLSAGIDAVTLNAGRGKSVGDSDFFTGIGGNLILGPTVSITAGSGGRTTLYTGMVSQSTGVLGMIGSGSGRARYGSDETTQTYLAPLGTGQYVIYRERPTLTLRGVSNSVIYGNEARTDVDGTGLVNGDTLSQSVGLLPSVILMNGGSAATRNANGHYDVRRDGGGQVVGYEMALSRDAVSSLGYALAYDDTGLATVTPRALSAVINDDAKFVTLADNAGYAGATFTGFARGDSAADLNVDALITRSVAGEAIGTYAGALTGNINVIAGNYVIDPAHVTAGDFHIVGPDALIVRVGSSSAVYGEVADFNVSEVRFFDTQSNLEVSLVQGSGMFNWTVAGNPSQSVDFLLNSAGINVGTHDISGSVITPHGLPGSGSTPNQLLAIGGRLTITPRQLTLHGSKVYDGTDVFGAGALTLGNLHNGETLTYGQAVAYSRNVATAENYIRHLTLGDGTGLASNYVLPDLSSWNAASNAVTITPRALGVTVDKVYDGLASATGGQTTLTNLVAGEALTIGAVSLSDAHVATAGKYVTSLTLLDAGSWLASNYILPDLTQVSASNAVSITPRAVTASIASASGTSKVYDGTTSTGADFLLSFAVGGYISGDVGGLTWTAAYDDRTVDAQRIQLSNLGLAIHSSAAGSQVSDYVLDTLPLSVSGRITPRTVSAAVSATPTKVYDGTTSANGATVSIAGATGSTGRIAGDNVDIVAVGGGFNSANAGTNLSYTLVDITLGGADARNYVLDSDTITGNDGIITARELTVSATKVYNGTTALTGIVLGNLVQGEYLNIGSANAASARVAGPDGNVNTDDNYVATLVLSNVMDGATAVYRTSNYRLPGTNAIVSGASNTLTAGPGNRVTITPVALTVGVSESHVTKVYDGTTAGSVNYTVSGLIAGDSAALINQTSGAFNSALVAGADTFTLAGIHLTGITGSQGSQASDYVLNTTNLVLPGSITARQVTVDVAGGIGKVYDGTTGFLGLEIGLSGLIAADANQVSVAAGGGGFDSKDAGVGKSYTLTGLHLTGAAAGNYQIASGDSLSGIDGIITRRALTIAGSLADDRIYDGTVDAVVNAGVLSGLVGSETLNIADVIGTFDNRNVGTRTVTANYVLADGSNGGLASNYFLADTTHTADINARTLTITGTTAGDRAYDGTTDAVVTAGTLSGFAGSETLTLSGVSGIFDNRNVGNRTVTASYTLADGSNGGLASNYVLADTTHAAEISARTLTITGTTAADKIYDGNTAAVVTAGTLTGFAGSETLTLDRVTGAFDNRNAGNRTVTASYTLADGSNGGLASNYVLADTTHAAEIRARTLTVTGTTAADKIYDGTTDAVVTAGTLSGFVGSETLALSGVSGTFDNRNVGNRSVTASYTLADGSNGWLASNYVLADTTHAAEIRARTLTITGTTAADKIYDGSTAAVLTGGTLSGFAGSETLTLGGVTGVFDNQNVGNRTVTASYTLADGSNGGLASNYVLADTTHAAEIRARTLTVTGTTADDKIYDGTTNAVVTAGTLAGFVGTETLNINSVVGSFDNQNVGNRTVTASYTLADGSNGGLAGNYVLADTTHAAEIRARTLTITGTTAADKIYDGNTTAVVTVGTLSGFAGSETLTLSGVSGTFDSRNAGDRIVTASYLLSDGSNGGVASNYVLADTTHGAEITPLTLVVTGTTANDKAYDGTSNAQVNAGALSGFIGSETVVINGATGTFDDRNAGARTVTASYTLADGSNGGLASNYALAATTHAATITPKFVTVTGLTASGRIYNGTTDASILHWGSVATGVAGETLALRHGAASFADKNAGERKTVTATGYSLADGSGLASNYRLSATSATTTAYIARAALTISYRGVNKVYDGNVSASVVTSDNRIAGDVLQISQTAAFVDKNVGRGKAVTISGISLSGVDADNYLPAAASMRASADITRLDAVTWVGGSEGDWFDPDNWAGGAVPDLANVANVIIPGGVEVTFGTPPVAPAQGGPVYIESLGVDGSLNQTGGTLNIGGGGMTLTDFTQSGGDLNSEGEVILDSFTQAGGNTAVDNDFTVHEDFSQTGGGTLSVTGDIRINDRSGGTDLGNIVAGGDLIIDSNDGDIRQTPDTAIVVDGETTVDAGSGNIVVDGAENDFRGPFSGNGHDVTVTDGHGGLNFGDVTAGGALRAHSHGGNIVQQPGSSIRTGGTASFNVTTHAGRAILTPGGNRFGGGLTVRDGRPGTGGLGLPEVIRPAAPALSLPTPESAPAVITPVATEPGRNEGLTVLLVKTPSAVDQGRVMVGVPREDASRGFSFRLPQRLIDGAPADAGMRCGLSNGSALPAWLRCVEASRTVVADSVPAGALPIEVEVVIGDQRSVVLIAGQAD